MNPKCQYCEEEVLPGEQAPYLQGGTMHKECLFRACAGSVSHIEKRCSCYGGTDTDLDPPGLTLRQAAKAAMIRYKAINLPKYAIRRNS